MTSTSPCFACGGAFAAGDGPTHDYMLSTPGCWAAFGDVLAREYADPALFAAAHRLTVDAYALQHPGDPTDPRARQSVWVHGAALHLAIDRQWSFAQIPAVMQGLTRQRLPPLPLVPPAFAITHASVIAGPAERHAALVEHWAGCTWDAWAALHAPVRALVASL